MNCKDIRENMFELMSAPSDLADPAAMAHVKECSGCAGELASMRATMNLLDEWEAPEPSVYFLSRFQANLREEREKQPRSWFAWLRRPVLALTMVTIVAAGGIFYRSSIFDPPPPPAPGTAVADLQALERNHDVYASFDLLDEIIDQPQQDVTD